MEIGQRARGFGSVVQMSIAIRGTITRPEGKPAQGVALMLMAAIGGPQESRLTILQWTTTNEGGHYALIVIPRGLTRAFLNVYAEPPDRRSHFEAIASGKFQGQAVISSVGFEPLNRDQDPLDFQLRLVTPELPVRPNVESEKESA
jgi:hypothetical protein